MPAEQREGRPDCQTWDDYRRMVLDGLAEMERSRASKPTPKPQPKAQAKPTVRPAMRGFDPAALWAKIRKTAA